MNSALDANSKQTMTARLETDGVTITRLTASALGVLSVTAMTFGAVTPKNYSATDENGRTSLFAVSEYDPTQLVALQCDSSGNLLVKSI